MLSLLTMRQKNQEVQYLRSQVTDLLNRLQAKDFRSYASLSSATGQLAPVADASPELIPLTDGEELRRLGLATQFGLGEVSLNDDGTDSTDYELEATLGELGIASNNS